MDNPEMQTTLRTRHRRKTKKTTHITEKDKQHTPICYYLRLVFLVYFWYCEDLLIIPDLKYVYCDMNYLFVLSVFDCCHPSLITFAVVNCNVLVIKGCLKYCL